MAKLGKNKIALFLACAQIFGGKTSAINTNKIQSKTIATVGTTSKNSGKKFVNWMKNYKYQLIAGTLTTATVVTLAALGIKYFIKEEPKDEEKNDINNEDNKMIKVEKEKEKEKEELKKEEPKKEEPKKVEPKKVEPKKVEPKKVEPKKVEPKDEEKNDINITEIIKVEKEKEKEEPKKEDSQEVDATSYILEKIQEKIKEK